MARVPEWLARRHYRISFGESVDNHVVIIIHYLCQNRALNR